MYQRGVIICEDKLQPSVFAVPMKILKSDRDNISVHRHGKAPASGAVYDVCCRGKAVKDKGRKRCISVSVGYKKWTLSSASSIDLFAYILRS